MHLRAKRQKKPVRIWEKMRRLLRQRFLPVDYESTLFVQYQQCKQGSRSVADYADEFQKLSSCTTLEESEEQMAARFVSRLKEKIQY